MTLVVRTAVFLSALQLGGGQRDALNLAAGLADLGHEVDFLVGDRSGELADEIPSGVSVFEFGSARSSLCILPMARYLRRRRPAALITSMTEQNVAGILARRASFTDTVMIAREVGAMSDLARGASTFKARRFPSVARRVLPLADAVVANSRGVAEDLALFINLPREKLRVIHNPALRPDVPELAAQPLEHPWFAPGAPPVILGLGRLHKHKDFPTLIRAFKEARRTREMRLMIVGEGEDRPALEALVRDLDLSDTVRLPGLALNPYPYLKRSATLVLSSTSEGFGNVLIEAMACGTSVVATDCPGGPREILEDGKHGILVPVGDHGALAAAIVRSLDEPTPPRQLEIAARRFSVEAICSRYVDLIGELTDARR